MLTVSNSCYGKKTHHECFLLPPQLWTLISKYTDAELQEAVVVTGLTPDTSCSSRLEVGAYTSGKVIQEIFISCFSHWWVLTFWVKQTFNEWEKYFKLYLSISKYILCFSLLPQRLQATGFKDKRLLERSQT